jgi:hypothetical protein
MALTSLKYFAEGAGQGTGHYQIVSAGSLLGVVSQRGDEGENDAGARATFPVGKVDEIIAYPMNFEEFLWANGQTWLADQIRDHYRRNLSLDATLHQQALKMYRAFLVVGGMPEAV